MVRDGLAHAEVTYREAYERVAQGLNAVAGRTGWRRRVRLAGLSNEEMYLAPDCPRGTGHQQRRLAVSHRFRHALRCSTGAGVHRFDRRRGVAGGERPHHLQHRHAVGAARPERRDPAAVRSEPGSSSQVVEDPLDAVAELKLDPMRGRSTRSSTRHPAAIEKASLRDRIGTLPGGEDQNLPLRRL